MNSYIDYDYYSETFGGTLLDESAFDKYAKIASMKVRSSIFDRDISYFKDTICSVTCVIAEILYNQYLNQEKLKNIISGDDNLITSEKVGDYSRNISNISVSELETYCSDDYVDKLINTELENYLFYTGLLYSGFPRV